MAAKLTKGSARLDFGEAAARFAGIAHSVRERQMMAARGNLEPGEPVGAPDELWNSRFGSQGFSASGMARTANFAPVPHQPPVTLDLGELKATVASRLAQSPRMDAVTSSRFAPNVAPVTPAGAPLGARLGKEARPRRSWLGRLFRGA